MVYKEENGRVTGASCHRCLLVVFVLRRKGERRQEIKQAKRRENIIIRGQMLVCTVPPLSSLSIGWTILFLVGLNPENPRKVDWERLIVAAFQVMVNWCAKRHGREVCLSNQQTRDRPEGLTGKIFPKIKRMTWRVAQVPKRLTMVADHGYIWGTFVKFQKTADASVREQI